MLAVAGASIVLHNTSPIANRVLGVQILPQPAPATAPAPTLSRTLILCAHRALPNCVIDGDTFRVDGNIVRISDIDAPEVFSPKCAAEKALGDRATQRLLALINAGPFVLETSGRDIDRYGRQLRVISRNGDSLGGMLVAEGLARPWDGARHPWCA